MALSSLLRRTPPPSLLLSPSAATTITTTTRLLSTSSPSSTTPNTSNPPPSSSLSSRMSSVLDHLDAHHHDLHDKDDALRRIRAWRHSNIQPHPYQHQHQHQQPIPTPSAERSKEEVEEEGHVNGSWGKDIELAHRWPEWIELLDRLLHQNYFDGGRFHEEPSAVDDSSRDNGNPVVGSVELTRDWTAVSAAVESFGKDRFDILKSLSRKDIGILVGQGCPNTVGKVVYSAKLLRKHAHLDEGDVCSTCSLRSTCKRGFLVLPKEDEARMLDVMRVLLTFAFDSMNGLVKNEPLMKVKSVKTVIRKLLHKIAKLSAVPIDPNLPRPVLKKAVPKVKQPPPAPKKRVGRDDVEMKKGDWLCPKCDFLNFAKNVVCLQCDAKRPKRQLLPGEWECPQCNFLNYRRNMACFRCECKRPPDECMESQVNTKEYDLQTARSKGTKIPNVADVWNLDFDDHESDGADVATFEYADPPRVGRSVHGGPLDGIQGFNDDFDEEDDKQRTYERRHFSESNKNPLHSPNMGFDDFDDEEDGVDNYEIMRNGEVVNHISYNNLPKFENVSDSDFDTIDSHMQANKNVRTPFADVEDGIHDSASEVYQSGLLHWKSSKKGRSSPPNSDQELDSDYDNMGQEFSHSLRENSRQRPIKHHVGRDGTSERDMWQNWRESPTDDKQNFRRPLRGEGFEYNRGTNDMVFDRDDFSGSGKKFQGGKSHSRPRRGERFGYNQHRNSNWFDGRPRPFGDRSCRRIIER